MGGWGVVPLGDWGFRGRCSGGQSAQGGACRKKGGTAITFRLLGALPVLWLKPGVAELVNPFRGSASFAIYY